MPKIKTTVPLRLEADYVRLSGAGSQYSATKSSHIAVSSCQSSRFNPHRFVRLTLRPCLSTVRTLTEFTTELELSRQRLLNGIKSAPFPQPTFTSLLPKMHMTHLIQSSWEETLFHRILFTPDAILGLLQEQYEAGSESISGNPSRWSIINSVIANAIMQKSTNDYLGTMAVSAWAHFKNAFSTFPELLTRGTNILACEALLAMALFMRATADARTTSQLTNAAVRLMHMIEFPNSTHNTSTEGSPRTRYDRVTSVAYILDAEILHKYGLPSAFRTIDFMSEDLKKVQNSQLSEGFPQIMIGLATAQFYIQEPSTSSGGSPMETAMQHWESVHKILQDWRCRHHHFLQTAELAEESLPTMQKVLVILTYHTTSIKLHMKRARLRHGLSLGMDIANGQCDGQKFEVSQSSWSSCISSARAMIRTMHGLESQAFHCLW